MRFTRFLILWAITAGLAFAGRVSGYTILAYSTFDLNAEGWTVVNNGASVNPDYHATGGNPGGYISDTDAASGPIWYFSAPSSFLGNKSAAAGGILRFDLRTTGGTFFDASDLVLVGGGLSLFATVKGIADQPNVFGNVQLTLADIDENVTWAAGTANGPAPTPQQFQTVLGNLTSLRIRGEYVSGGDTGSIDNVFLEEAPASTPEPATFATAGLVLCALYFFPGKASNHCPS